MMLPAFNDPPALREWAKGVIKQKRDKAETVSFCNLFYEKAVKDGDVTEANRLTAYRIWLERES